MLNTITHGEPTDAPPLLIAHGLFGSGRNWGVIAKRLSDKRQVIAVDMRNHAGSPWYDTNSYEDMAGDLAEVLEEIGPADVLGHSMGGKTSMVLALSRPELVNRLIVADIAPVAYQHSQSDKIAAMRSVDLDTVTRRSEVDALLEAQFGDRTLATFLSQSLDLKDKSWRLNLDVLDAEMPKIIGFPEVDGRYDGRVLFLTGGTSTYVRREDRDRIKALFPKVRFAGIPGAGHWLHAEKPREFVAAVDAWLSA
ncbi:alpha/beta fold hydrolase [Pseudooceanicola sp. LIPI14-2-Ac024]|uniref:alpha/beta fold hydrolase n=1 Tax=Pseudooceanicola sp. LIPI14-2-Ac024 TaxID=3344875 RepID=UPI0035D07D3B